MSKRSRHWLVALVACSTATVFQFLPSGCGQFTAHGTLTALDFCALVNCEGGAFFNFCEPVGTVIDCAPRADEP